MVSESQHVNCVEFTLTPGIAAYITVSCEAFPEHFGHRECGYIYISPDKPIETSPGGCVKFEDLPVLVQQEIADHFDRVFGLPIESRQAYLNHTPPWRVFTSYQIQPT